MTFNSPDEKRVFSKHLTPVGYEHVELVPENKDPFWFNKACASVKACDILVVSGHFGGLFFGEQSATISLAELISAREEGSCPAILDKPKAVYLMGCNTLSSKSPDHRSVDDYLRVLVGDGFPLRLAEEVAAARYLNFGQSMAESMSSIFINTPMIVGFESTGPLGAQAAPKLEQAFKTSTLQDKNTTGVSKSSILTAFKGSNLRVVAPQKTPQDQLKIDAISTNEEIASRAWISILSSQNLIKHYDFIIKNKTNKNLSRVIANNLNTVGKNVHDKMLGIYQSATGLSEIQVKILSFIKYHNLINFYVYEDALVSISEGILSRELDYIGADQLCSVFSEHKDVGIFNRLGSFAQMKMYKSVYGNYLMKCAGIALEKKTYSKAFQCLINFENHDWGCLTDNQTSLDVEACILAKSRNKDPENADDMMWYCYSKMREHNYLNRAVCLELTHNFSLLGNQLKMNWNCLNRIPN